MRGFIRLCVGAIAVALGVAVVPLATSAAAASAATSASQATQQHPLNGTARYGTIAAPRLVNLRAVSRAAATGHPQLAAPLRYFNPSLTAAQRAAAVSSGGRRSGLTALGGSLAGVQSVSPGHAWADFPAMSLGRQYSIFGSDQLVQPPDTQVAAGPGAVLEATNDSLSVWSKTGVLLAGADLNVFFAVPSSQLFTDPRVLYDTQSGHWLLSGYSFDNSGDSQTYLAVSATSDPTGTWYAYTVEDNSKTGVLTDQPVTGVCADKVVMSWDNFTASPNGFQFQQAQTLVLQKSALIAGATKVPKTTLTSPSAGEFRLVPAQSLSATSTCWMTVNNADSALGGSSTSPTLGVVAVTGTPALGDVAQTETDLPLATPTSPPPDPQQPSGVTNDYQANDDRLLSAVWQDGTLWTSATDACTPAGDTATRDCLRLWQVDTSSGTPALRVDTDLAQVGTDLYYPAVSLDSAGDLFVSYSASSSSLYPGAYAVISPSASAGAFSAPVTIAAGRASYNGGRTTSRWGDYSAAAPDPSLPGAVWVAGEYAPSNAALGYWSTAAAEVSLTAPPPVAVAVGAEGGNGALWVQAPQLGSGWKPLGGKIIAPPAIAAVPNPDGTTPAQPLFVATGTNKRLFIRSLTAGWQVLGPATGSCLGGPAAVVTGTAPNGPFQLTVACRGLNNALWVNSAPLPASGLPRFTAGWKTLGGVLSAGPAVAPVGGVLTFFVRGTNGHIYLRTLTAGYRQMPWVCSGAPAAALAAASSDTVFACQAGSNHALWQAAKGVIGVPVNVGWTPVAPLGGALIGGPGVAAASRVTEFLVEGTNRAVWERTPTSGWHSLGGIVVGGVAAAALN